MPPVSPAPAFDRRRLAAEAAEQHRADRAVHRLRHLVGEDRARRADDHARDDQRGVVERDAGRRGAEAREGVERRDHDRHVGAADRQHDEVAEDPGGDEDDDEEARSLVDPARIATPAPTATSSSAMFTNSPAGIFTGLPEMSPWSLAKAMFEPQKEIEPMIAPKTSGMPVAEVGAEVAVGLEELRQRDERDRAAADAVEQRHHLRHRRHLHVARGRDADGRADRDADRDEHEVARRRAPRRCPPRSDAAASRRPRRACRRRRSGCPGPPSSGSSAARGR